MQTNRDLTYSQWDVLEPLIPEPSRREDLHFGGTSTTWKPALTLRVMAEIAMLKENNAAAWARVRDVES
jgi:hypothetical protein